MTMPASRGDAEAYLSLRQALDRHRHDKPVQTAWRDAGQKLEMRRLALGYDNRRQFAAERDINYKLAADIETGYRQTMTAAVIIKKVAPAYAVTPESFGAALDGGSLVPADAPVPAVTVLDVRPPPAAGMVLSPDLIAAAQPYANRIFLRLRDLAAEGNTDPAGADIFGAGSRDALSWTHHRAELSVDELVWLIAGLQARAATASGRDATGRAAGG